MFKEVLTAESHLSPPLSCPVSKRQNPQGGVRAGFKCSGIDILQETQEPRGPKIELYPLYIQNAVLLRCCIGPVRTLHSVANVPAGASAPARGALDQQCLAGAGHCQGWPRGVP